MTWASAQDVVDMLAETVSVQDLAIASAMIDTKAGVTEEIPEDELPARDRVTLRKATVWQAVWVRDHPGLITEVSASRTVSAAGVTDQRDSVTSVMYAPMAILELKNLSWNGTRSVYIRPRERDFRERNFLNEASDAYGTWKPL